MSLMVYEIERNLKKNKSKYCLLSKHCKKK